MNVKKNIGLEGLGDELTRIPGAIAGAVDDALMLQGALMYAKTYCPTASGALRDSIRVERPSRDAALLAAGGLAYINPVTGGPVTYAGAVHDGSSRMAPRPFLIQALAAEREHIASMIALGSVARL